VTFSLHGGGRRGAVRRRQSPELPPDQPDQRRSRDHASVDPAQPCRRRAAQMPIAGSPTSALFRGRRRVSTDDTPEGQATVAAGLAATARAARAHWRDPGRPVDAFTAKAGCARRAHRRLGCRWRICRSAVTRPAGTIPAAPGAFASAPGPLRPFRRAASCGCWRISSSRGPAVAFEVFLDAAPAAAPRRGPSRPAAQALAVSNRSSADFAFLVPTDLPAESLPARGGAAPADKEADRRDPPVRTSMRAPACPKVASPLAHHGRAAARGGDV